MSEINKIIDNFFEEAAWTIMYDNRKCFADLKEKWVADLTLTNERTLISEIQEEYLKLLDDIDKLVYGKKDENNSYVSYYKGKELFEIDVNISDIIEKVKQSSNSGDMAESLKEDVKKRLLEKNGYRRIAQLYYYKKNHKWYEEEVEEAYREIVDSVIGEYNITTVAVVKLTDEEIKKKTDKINQKAQENVYDEVYGNINLLQQYIMPFSEYQSICGEEISKYVIGETDYIKRKADSGLKNYYKKYYKLIYKRLKEKQFWKLGRCYKEYCKREGYLIKAEAAYTDFFKYTITALVGFNFEEIKEELNLPKNLILRTIVPDLNDKIEYFRKKFGRAKLLIKKKEFTKYYADDYEKLNLSQVIDKVESFDDIENIGNLHTIFFQIILAIKRENMREDFNCDRDCS